MDPKIINQYQIAVSDFGAARSGGAGQDVRNADKICDVKIWDTPAVFLVHHFGDGGPRWRIPQPPPAKVLPSGKARMLQG